MAASEIDRTFGSVPRVSDGIGDSAAICALAFEEGRRTLDEQARTLEQLRGRITGLVTAATAVVAFMGGVALQAADSDKRWWYWTGVGIGGALYLWIMVAMSLALRPRYVWRFSFSPLLILDGYADHETPATLAETHKELAKFEQISIDHNEENLARMRRLLSNALTALILSVACWGVLALRVG